MHDMFSMIASFTRPMDLTTNINSLMLIVPLLLSISFVYKATKIKVFFLKKYIRESLVLFVTISVFMALAAAGLGLLIYLVL